MFSKINGKETHIQRYLRTVIWRWRCDLFFLFTIEISIKWIYRLTTIDCSTTPRRTFVYLQLHRKNLRSIAQSHRRIEYVPWMDPWHERGKVWMRSMDAQGWMQDALLKRWWPRFACIFCLRSDSFVVSLCLDFCRPSDWKILIFTVFDLKVAR